MMTIGQAIDKAAAELDKAIDQAHRRFEQSLIDNGAPADAIDDLREYEREHMQAWRTHTLAVICRKLLEPRDAQETVH